MWCSHFVKGGKLFRFFLPGYQGLHTSYPMVEKTKVLCPIKNTAFTQNMTKPFDDYNTFDILQLWLKSSTTWRILSLNRKMSSFLRTEKKNYNRNVKKKLIITSCCQNSKLFLICILGLHCCLRLNLLIISRYFKVIRIQQELSFHCYLFTWKNAQK